MTLGTKIQELRKKQSLSQEAFAEIMDVTRQSVSKWELDQSRPEIEKLVQIADFFHVSLDELLKDQVDSTGITNATSQDSSHEKAANMNTIMKQYLGYFLWWAVLVIIILILFGIKEYFAGFIVSQILVWSTAILLVYRYVKKKKRKI